MNFKNSIIRLLCISFSCCGMDYSPPQSPNKIAGPVGSPRTPMAVIAAAHPRFQPTTPPASSPFWRSGSSNESSPASSMGSPSKASLSNMSPFGSPLGKRRRDDAVESGLEYPVARRLTFARPSVKDALEAPSEKSALGIIARLPEGDIATHVQELLRNLPPERDLFNVAEYNEVWLAVVQALNTKFKKATHSPLDFLPLLSFEHMQKGDRGGGYHFESADKPVERIITNPKTGIYAASFEQGRRRKSSSFFTKTFDHSISDIQYAFRHPIVSSKENIIGRAPDGSYIQILLQPSGIVARTAFPLVAYVSEDTPGDYLLDLEHVDKTHPTPVLHTYTAAGLRDMAGRGRVELETDDGVVIVDVAAALTGFAEARGVYVQMPTD